MAHTEKEPTGAPEPIGQSVTGTEGAEGSIVAEGFASPKTNGVLSKSGGGASDLVGGEGSSLVPPVELQSNSTTTRPTLVQLGSHAPPTSSSTSAPHPKRFSTVNISKMFLEKNSTATGSAPASTNPTTAKPGLSSSRPPTHSAPSHSRLVTTKLTTAPPTSSTTGPGWSRPSSATPPVAGGNSSSPNTSSPLLPTVPVAVPLPAAPQLPVAGKVIQPQPRSALVQSGATQKESATKPVWGNVKPPQATPLVPEIIAQNDFPTAAEVAQVSSLPRKPKATESKGVSDTAAASKQARMEEADTFRGLHLDPNAHHWDEMEEDDDNFLDGVIEFGDGRQYKIESADSQPDHLLVSQSPDGPDGRPPTKDSTSPSSNAIVSKEERFADDFDRSWPRSRTSPASSTRESVSAVHAQVSSSGAATSPRPAAPPSLHSPQESSRALFNERSNKLEPYHTSQRPGQLLTKRGPYDPASSPPEGRGLRDPQVTSPSRSHFQLGHKPGPEYPARNRGASGDSSNGRFAPADDRRQPHKDHPPRRDGYVPGSMGPPPSPRMQRDNRLSASQSGRERDNPPDGRGRRTVMGPPQHVGGLSSPDNGRQLRPHMVPASPQSGNRRLPSRDSRYPLVPGDGPAASILASPRRSLVSPALPVVPLPTAVLPSHLSAPELDEARKDVMQSAAARAKQRRQQEEAEREKEKERARQKAAELEERMKAAEAAKSSSAPQASPSSTTQVQDVLEVIEDAINSAKVRDQDTAAPPHLQASPLLPKAQLHRPPSMRGTTRQTPFETPQANSLRRSSVSSATHNQNPADLGSWRSKAPPRAQPPPATQQAPRPPPFVPPSITDPPDLTSAAEEDLEVVDFSDLGKFVGGNEPQPQEPSEVTVESSPKSVRDATLNPRPPRPVASDFFDNTQSSVLEPTRPNLGPWRRPPAAANATVVDQKTEERIEGRVELPVQEPAPETPLQEESASGEQQNPGHSSINSVHSHGQRASRTQGSFYNEAAISALDNAMSRIKGAIDGMQGPDLHKETPVKHEQEASNGRPVPQSKSAHQKDRWIPPPFRPRNVDGDTEETFDVTICGLPASPRLPSTAVRLPRISHRLEPISKRQLIVFFESGEHNVPSFEPPVPGMSRRDFLFNDVTSQKQPGGFKQGAKYRVVLPRYGRSPNLRPKVNIPSQSGPQKAAGFGAFGRPAGADASTWRRPAVASEKKDPDAISPVQELNTTSRSPPPELPAKSSNVPGLEQDSMDGSKKDEATSLRSRTQPKMPLGSAVAFYRDSRVDSVEVDPKPAVTFVVSSELEEAARASAQPITPTKTQPNVTVSPLAHGSETRKSIDLTARSVLSPNDLNNSPLSQAMGENKLMESLNPVATTPPSHQTTHHRASLSMPLKESPARAPDPEHLRAVWSQTSNKAGIHTVNSLEGIADDLLPFTLQDVKSEDGETPPPSVPSAPSRMSLHDVTRAFQRVPPTPSTNNVSHRTPVSPAMTTAPVARPAAYGYQMLPSRPPYPPPYSSPMMSHSPAPVMYPHLAPSPVPNRMAAGSHSPIYGQPVWLPMAGPPPQNHGNVMRPMGSPYPAQLMAYNSNPQGMYGHPPPNMQSAPSQQNLAQVNRGRNLPMMSPVMSPAAPQMYAGSPVLMQPSLMQVPPQNHGYMHMQPSRGQPRPENGHMPMHQHQQPPQAIHPPHPAYNPRPTW